MTSTNTQTQLRDTGTGEPDTSDGPVNAPQAPESQKESRRLAIRKDYREQDAAQEFVLDRVVDHGLDDDNVTKYRCRWYGYSSDQDTWEPIEHIPRSHVKRYYRRRRLPIPPTISSADVGLLQ